MLAAEGDGPKPGRRADPATQAWATVSGDLWGSTWFGGRTEYREKSRDSQENGEKGRRISGRMTMHAPICRVECRSGFDTRLDASCCGSLCRNEEMFHA
jgi:hypothetical protein